MAGFRGMGVIAGVLIVLSAACGDGRGEGPDAVETGAATVPALVETTPVGSGGDAADDPAIWRHPEDPALSVVIGTDKQNALEVYDLAGSRLQRIDGIRPNNVDVRGDIVVAADDESRLLRFFLVDTVTRTLTAAGTQATGVDAHGVCMYTSRATGDVYAFPNDLDGRTEQWRLARDGGTVTAALVRGPWDVGGSVEGCAAADDRGHMYIGEETGALWRYGAEPGDPVDARTRVAHVGDGNLTADIEGMAVADGRLYVSSQGDDSFVVYDVESGAFVKKFSVTSGAGADDCEQTDGLDAAPGAFGEDFPDGLFVCQDGENEAPGVGHQGFKYVRLDQVEAV